MKKWSKKVKKYFKNHRGAFAITVLIAALAVVFLLGSYLVIPGFFKTSYTAAISLSTSTVEGTTPTSTPRVATHVQTPDSVRAIYMTSWVAGTPHIRDPLIKLIDDTEINAVVVDIKDYSGMISFEVNDPELKKVGSVEKRIADIDGFIDMLHAKGIYVIGRISVFQDAHMVNVHPEWAVKKNSDRTKVWADYKGISWIDVEAKPAWEYIDRIGKEAYARGFDELNFDYIRFPSDGNMKDIYYPWSGTTTKPVALKAFFKHLHDTFKPLNIPISADLFGMVTTNTDDLNIGQVLENALPYFDFIAPMVYPSHYPKTWNNFSDPEKYPYEVIQISMSEAVRRAKAMGENPRKLRPWLQDFALRVPAYTADDIRAQIDATYDSGLNSWMLWSASNRYTKSALLSPNASTTPSRVRTTSKPIVPIKAATSTVQATSTATTTQ